MFNTPLHELSPCCHGVWLCMLLDDSMERWRRERFSLRNFRWAAARKIVRWLPRALSGVMRKDPPDNAIQCAMALSGLGHDYDTAPGVFGVDARAVYGAGMLLERMMDDPADYADEGDTEDELKLAAELAAFARADYLPSLEKAFQELAGKKIPEPAARTWVAGWLRDPVLAQMVRDLPEL